MLPVPGKNEVEDDSHDGRQGNPLQGEHKIPAHREGEGSSPDPDDEDDAADREVALILVIDTAVDQRSQTAGSDDSKKEHRDAAEDGTGDRLDQRSELGEEGEQNRDHRSTSGHPHGVHAGESKHADVLAVGGVRRPTPQRCPQGRQPVSGKGTVQAGVDEVVLADDLADRDRITKVLADRRQRNDHERHRGNKVELGNGEGRQTEPRRLADRGEIDQGMGGADEADEQGKEISGHQTDENRDDREEPFQKEIRRDREAEGHQCHEEHQEVVVARRIIHRHSHRRRSQ